MIENYARGSGASPRAEAEVDYEAVMADLEVVMRDSKVASSSAHNLRHVLDTTTSVCRSSGPRTTATTAPSSSGWRGTTWAPTGARTAGAGQTGAGRSDGDLKYVERADLIFVSLKCATKSWTKYTMHIQCSEV